MPLYEYECKKCHHRFERIQKFSDRMVKKCPDCGGPVEQMISAPAVQFKVGSVTTTLPAGVTALVQYAKVGDTTWTYVPASAACSAPAGYDRCVNRIRWQLQNPLSYSAPNNAGTLQFVAQIR